MTEDADSVWSTMGERRVDVPLARRTLLSTAGSIGALSMAGCLDRMESEPGTERPATPETLEENSGPTIVDAGQPAAVIVHAEDPPGTAEDAIEEFQYWIDRITGTELPAVTAQEWLDADDDRTPVGIGQSQFTEDIGVSVDQLGPEGARVRITDSTVALVGRDSPPTPEITWRGSYYAVMELLRHLGVSWIWPGELGEVYPETETLTLAPNEWTWESDLFFGRGIRIMALSHMWERWTASVGNVEVSDERTSELWDLGTQWTRRQRGHPRVPRQPEIDTGHAFTDYFERYADEHPEWFAEPPGDLDRIEAVQTPHRALLDLANGELQDHVFESWKGEWDENPALNRVMSLYPNDADSGYCTGDTCRAWDEGRNDEFSDWDIWNGADGVVVTERYVHFWNSMARRVREVDDDAMVGTYAYNHYRSPPVVNDVEDNVIVGYVNFGNHYPEEPEIVEEIEAWADAGAKFFWRPNLLYVGHGMPYVFPTTLADHIKRFYQQGMVGFDFDGGGMHWATQGINYYVIGERMWRPTASTEELLQEYYDAFGPAADAVQEYFEFWEAFTASEGVELAKEERDMSEPGVSKDFVPIVAQLYDDEVFDEAGAMLDRAESAVEDGDEVYADRVAFLRTGLEHSRLTIAYLHAVDTWRDEQTEENLAAARTAEERLTSFREDHRGSLAVNHHQMHANEVTLEYRPLEQIVDRGFEVESPQRPLTVDGSLEELAGLEPVFTVEDDFSLFRGDPQVTGDLWVTWDGEHLYLAADLSDPTHDQENVDTNLWAGDAIQLGVAPGAPGTSEAWDAFNVALTPEGPQVTHRPHPDGTSGLLDAPLEIVRQDGRTVYELAIPWDVLQAASDDETIGLNVALVDHADGEEAGLLELAGGIFGGKDPSEFGTVHLTE